jgi:hypothetical protein
VRLLLISDNDFIQEELYLDTLSSYPDSGPCLAFSLKEGYLIRCFQWRLPASVYTFNDETLTQYIESTVAPFIKQKFNYNFVGSAASIKIPCADSPAICFAPETQEDSFRLRLSINNYLEFQL